MNDVEELFVNLVQYIDLDAPVVVTIERYFGKPYDRSDFGDQLLKYKV